MHAPLPTVGVPSSLAAFSNVVLSRSNLARWTNSELFEKLMQNRFVLLRSSDAKSLNLARVCRVGSPASAPYKVALGDGSFVDTRVKLVLAGVGSGRRSETSMRIDAISDQKVTPELYRRFLSDGVVPAKSLVDALVEEQERMVRDVNQGRGCGVVTADGLSCVAWGSQRDHTCSVLLRSWQVEVTERETGASLGGDAGNYLGPTKIRGEFHFVMLVRGWVGVRMCARSRGVHCVA